MGQGSHQEMHTFYEFMPFWYGFQQNIDFGFSSARRQWHIVLATREHVSRLAERLTRQQAVAGTGFQKPEMTLKSIY